MPLAMFAVAAPRAAATTCQTSQNPNGASAQASLKVGCITDLSATATQNVNHIDVHDGLNAAWHRGAARSVSVTTAVSTTITFAAGTIQNVDVRRPISGPGIAGGAFIRSVAPAACTTACTSAVLSVASTAAATVTATVEHTSSRTLQDARYSAGATSTLTSATGTFAATDVNKSVSGGSFPAGSRISAFTNATTVTVTPGGTTAVMSPATDIITIGEVQYTAASPSTATTYTETWTREMKRTTDSRHRQLHGQHAHDRGSRWRYQHRRHPAPGDLRRHQWRDDGGRALAGHCASGGHDPHAERSLLGRCVDQRGHR